MSLRDQLIAKGVVSKKEASRVERDLKRQRKAQAGKRGPRGLEQSLAEVADKTERQMRQDARDAERLRAAQEREAHERQFRIKQIIDHHALSGRGPVIFYHRVGSSGRIAKLALPMATVRELRGGRAAIACYDAPQGWVCRVVGYRAAEKLQAIDKTVLVHFTPDPAGLDDPANAPAQRSWEPDLRAHRVFDQDA